MINSFKTWLWETWFAAFGPNLVQPTSIKIRL